MIDLIKSAAERMMVDFEYTRKIYHNPTKGRTREYLVAENFLEKYLPNRYSIGSGLIVDAEQRESKQQDLIIYDEFNSPVLLDTKSDKILFSESVQAVVEVKSTLNGSQIKDIVEKFANVWQLAINPKLSKNRKLNYVPILCTAICYESTLSLDGIAERVRKQTEDIEKGFALSNICVLKDKNGVSGLILKMNHRHLKEVQIIPEEKSRIGVIKSESGGDALLYYYLLMMEHLQNLEKQLPGPDLKYYAENSDLGQFDFQMTRDEFMKGSIKVEGESIKMSDADKMRELTQKIFNKRDATEGDIIKWYYLIPKMPKGSLVKNSNSVFIHDGKEIDTTSPSEIYSAVEKFINGDATNEDAESIEELIDLVKTTLKYGTGVKILDSTSDDDALLQFGKLEN